VIPHPSWLGLVDLVMAGAATAPTALMPRRMVSISLRTEQMLEVRQAPVVGRMLVAVTVTEIDKMLTARHE
jgi:hypothetical protein